MLNEINAGRLAHHVMHISDTRLRRSILNASTGWPQKYSKTGTLLAADAQGNGANLVLQCKTPDALHRAFIGTVKKQEN
jgi:hypothetical protein